MASNWTTSALNYQILFESLPGLYLILTREFDIAAASDAYLKATLTKRDIIVGRNIFAVFTDNTENPDATGVQKLRASLETVLVTRAGDAMAVTKYDVLKPESEGGGFEERYWSPFNAPILDKGGEVAYIIHRVEDVTEFVRLKQQESAQNEASAQLRERTQRMESEIYLRAQEVNEANRKLSSANQELEKLYAKTKELDELKTNFFANVSHELRTPLTLILGPLAKRLALTTLQDAERRDLQMMQRNALMLLKHVNDLLDIAKLDAGKLDITYTRANIAELIKYIILNLQIFAEEKNIRLLSSAPDACIAEVDVVKLTRILLNLLSNAVKFTPSGGATSLTVAVESERITFSVTDTGPGIPEGMRRAVFERFRQVEDVSSRKSGGTGLGLAIVKELVELHRGTIEVCDSPSGGAIFVVNLPIKAPQGVYVSNAEKLSEESLDTILVAELIPPVVPGADTVQSSNHADTVLVVEDNPDMRAYIVDMLRPLYRVETAENGKIGLEKARLCFPDLIISDVMMPEMSGDEMVAALSNIQETQGIPILMLTAKMDDSLKVSMLKQGVYDYISKPFAAEELIVKVQNLSAARRRNIAEREHLIRQLTRSNQELEQFAFVAAHDLKSPLRSIDNLSQWIEQDAADVLTGETKQHLIRLRQQVCYMEKILNDVLDYSRVGSKLNSHAAEMVSGADLLNNISAQVGSPSGFTISGTDEFNRLQIKRMPLQQVFYNLIQNAIKHHGKETGFVHLSVQEHDGRYAFRVCDDGPGIATEYHEKIFEMFQTLKPKHQSNSTGMGLALVKKLVTMYGGTIKIDSAPGNGACFCFTWPKE